MKNRFTLLMVLFALSAFTFISCDDNDNDDTAGKGGKYFINYGSYSGDKTTISAYDDKVDTITNNHYKAVNGVDMVSNAQYAYRYNGNIYFMGNNADEITYVDEDSFEQTANGISGTDIIKPRHCIGNGDFLYVSCWGGDAWVDNSLSYIAKIDIKTDKVVEKISVPGGAEGVAFANDKLFVALSYADSVAVVNLSNNEVSFIATPAVTSFFLKDNNDNLYVSLISTYSNPSTETGLGYINTANNELTSVYQLDGVSSTYDNVMAANGDFSKIYLMAASGSMVDGAWVVSGSVETFDVASKTYESESLISNITGLNGVVTDDNDIFCLVSESTTANGVAKKYAADGTFIKEYETGISPILLIDVD